MINFDEPPINDPIQKEDGTFSEIWRANITSTYQTLNANWGQYGLCVPPVVQTHLQTSLPDGTIAFNTTTKQLNIIVTGVWHEITHA